MQRRATGPKRKLSAVYKFVRRDTESQSSDEDDDDDETGDESLDYSTDVGVKEDDIETDEDIDLDTDTKSEEDLEPGELDYVRQKTLIPEEDFFKLLESFPSLSDFLEESEDMEAEVKTEAIEEEEESIDYEGGVFVDPLTGEVRSKIITEPKEYGKEAQEKSVTKIESITEPATGPDIEPEIMSRPGSDDFWYEELDALYKSEEEAAEIALKKEEESNIEAMFADEVEEPVLIIAHFDFEAWQKIEGMRIIEESIVELLVDIIKIAIESSERDNAINQLYNNLNKNKIMKELFKLRNEQENENWLRTHLNRKCAEHYKRKKLYRTITEESTKVADYYKRKLYEQMIRLDNLLSEEEALKAKTENLVLQLRKDVEDLKAINQNELENFENMILHNIIRPDCIHLRNSMRRPMDDMARERKNISLLHRKIIAKQHIILTTKKVSYVRRQWT